MSSIYFHYDISMRSGNIKKILLIVGVGLTSLFPTLARAQKNAIKTTQKVTPCLWEKQVVVPSVTAKIQRRVFQCQSLATSLRQFPTRNATTFVLSTIIVPPHKPKLFAPPTNVSRPEIPPQDYYAMCREQEFLLNTISAGYVYPFYTTESGQRFFPYEQALLRAETEENILMLEQLKKLEGMQKSLLFSDEAVERLGLQNLPTKETKQIINQVYEYIKDTAIMMALGYSWGTTPLQIDIIPLSYHTPLFYQYFIHFQQRHPTFLTDHQL